jgi:succinate dehydrogenase / fumarate reductase cytochrome b subunit
MPYTGLVILAFAAFHIAHYTLGGFETVRARSIHTGKMVQSNYLDLVDAQGRHDVYSMVVMGFSDPIVSTIYVLAMLLLFVHLKHGIGSVFQTLGLNTPRLQPWVRRFGFLFAFLICFGNIALVSTIWLGQVPIDPSPRTTAGEIPAQPRVPAG